MIGHILRFVLFSLVAIAAVLPVMLLQCDNKQSVQEAPPKEEVKEIDQVKVIEKEPEVLVSTLPNFAQYHDVKQKKRAFFSYLRPFVEQINAGILDERQFVQNIDVATASPADIAKLKRTLSRYKVKNVDFTSAESIATNKVELLKRLDVIPVELVLMQAANESAWGTSRFALQANNLFGQWCFKVGCGVVPAGRPDGETYEVRKFNSPKESIRSYFFNLNTGYAYDELRTLRATLRSMNESIDPYVIAEGLLPYSTRREAYVDEIQNMIRINKKYI